MLKDDERRRSRSGSDDRRTEGPRAELTKKETSGLAGPSPEQHGPASSGVDPSVGEDHGQDQGGFLLSATGVLHPLPGEDDPFHWEIRNQSLLGCWTTFTSRLHAHLKMRVPFIVEGHERILKCQVEVYSCD